MPNEALVVRCWRSIGRVVKLLYVVSFAVIVVSVCASAVLKILEGKGFKKIIFLSGKAEALLQFLVCALACANCKCAYACVLG